MLPALLPNTGNALVQPEMDPPPEPEVKPKRTRGTRASQRQLDRELKEEAEKIRKGVIFSIAILFNHKGCLLWEAITQFFNLNNHFYIKIVGKSRRLTFVGSILIFDFLLDLW